MAVTPILADPPDGRRTPARAGRSLALDSEVSK